MYFLAIIGKILFISLLSLIPIFAGLLILDVTKEYIKSRKKIDLIFIFVLAALEVLGRLAILDILFAEIFV